MIRVYLVNGIDDELLEEVKAEMQVLGSPTIRVYDAQDYYYALEGSHRLTAAAELGLAVKFDVIDGDDEIDLRTLDLDENNWALHWERDIPVLCDELVSRMAEFKRDHVVDVEIG